MKRVEVTTKSHDIDISSEYDLSDCVGKQKKQFPCNEILKKIQYFEMAFDKK